MQERETQAPEQVHLHERGGLTPAHWQEVLDLLAIYDNPTRAKITHYGQAVINGEVEDHNFNHRNYLGHRHWDEIASSLRHQKNTSPIAKEVEIYAILERSVSFSLDDFFDRHKRRYGVGVSYKRDIGSIRREDLVWSNNTWRLQVEKTYYPPYDPDCDPGPAPDPVLSKKEKSKRAATQTLLHHWLLNKKEVHDPLHTSPEQLLALLRNQIPPDLLLTRVMKYFERHNNMRISCDLTRLEDLWTRLKGGSLSVNEVQESYSRHFGFMPYVIFYQGLVNHEIGRLKALRIFTSKQEFRRSEGPLVKAGTFVEGEIKRKKNVPPTRLRGWEKEI